MRSAMILSGAVVALGLMSQGTASAQDAAAGERIFNQCRACHQVGPTARVAVGPPLNGLFAGRKAGSWPGYTYSDAYKTLDKVWTEENFTTYIKDPRGVTPGTKMVYAGLKDETQIKNLIAFMKQYAPDGVRTQ